jgi:phosphate acetyltransferase
MIENVEKKMYCYDISNPTKARGVLPMDFTSKMKAKAKANPGTIVLPESLDPRILKAARVLLDDQLATSVTLVGDEKAIRDLAAREGVSLAGFVIDNPAVSPDKEAFIEEFYNLRKHKGISLADAAAAMAKPVFWGAMLVNRDRVDAMVAGAATATADVLKAAIPIIKTRPGTKCASSCFVMCHPDPRWGHEGQMIFSDCGTVPDPDPEQLSEIALAAARSCRSFLDTEPVVALLSFSTKGSANHPSVTKVTEALKLIRQKDPELCVDGELQGDAALIPEVAAFKAPGSCVGGKANVLIFPDLNSGNICYKLVQRLGGCKAFGPILQGFSKPVSDLSRGCWVDDVVNIAVRTMIQKG